MRTHRDLLLGATTLSFALIALAPTIARAQAQPAQTQTATTSAVESTADLFNTQAFRGMVQGKTVRITTTTGLLLQGPITVLSSTDMVINGARVPFLQVAKVEKVSHRVRNGALVGLGIGAGLVGTVFAVCSAANDEYCGTGGEAFAFTAVYGAIGAGIGAGIGALRNLGRRETDVLYDSARRTTTVAVVPALGAARKGVALSISWR